MVEMSRILCVFSANVIIKLIKCYFFQWNCSSFIYI